MERKSYIRRHGEYRYDVEIQEINLLAGTLRYAAKAVNSERLLSKGRTEPLDVEIGEEHGATTDEAFKKIEAAVIEWAERQPKG